MNDQDFSVKLYQGNCLEKMALIPDNSVDMVLADPPYGTTQCKWDSVIPFDFMWDQLKRITKNNGAIVLTASQPFTSALTMSNVKMFKQSLVWSKNKATGHLNANKMIMRSHEDICVFYSKLPTYNPQMTDGEPYSNSHKFGDSGDCYGAVGESKRFNVTKRFPKSVMAFNVDIKAEFHPTQKPVALMEYLIKTYTNECETVLDFTMGSGTTGVACVNTKRSFIGIELDENYFSIASKRINGGA
jgi:DNA modification methylase